MQSRTLLITVATLLSQSVGTLIIAPSDTESKAGDTTYFNCSTNLTSKEIFWNHREANLTSKKIFWNQREKYVYSENGILPPYDERFEIDRNSSNGSYNLVIHSVEPGDAGEYICIDDDGHGTRGSAQLVVLDNDPDCQSNIKSDGVIGQNKFNITPDEVQLTCTVTYHGNIPPEMEWKKVGDYNATDDSVATSVTYDNRLIYNLNLKGHISMDKSSYICQTKRSTQNQYKCISKEIKVLYVIDINMKEKNAFRGDDVTCIASNNTFPCNRQWYHDNYTCPLSCAETITTHLLGEYLCRVKCDIRGAEYSFTALKVVVEESATSPTLFTPGVIAASVVVPVVISALVVFIAVRKVQNAKRENARKMRMIKLKDEDECKKLKREEIVEYEVVKEKLELLHAIKREGTTEEKTIVGVAILDEKLWLVHKESSTLEFYDCNSLSSASKSVVVPELVAAADICSSLKNNRLYIMDTKDPDFIEERKFEDREIFKISPKGKLIRKWRTKNDAGGFLSATEDGNVIVTFQDNHMLLEYSSYGICVRVINLSSCIRPWHAIKLDDDRYIVSHGTYDHLHRVCLVNKKGDTVRSFGGEMGSTGNRLHIPYYLAVGSSGCVLVADLCNDRVLLLDKDVEVCKAIIVPKCKQRFRRPRRIHLDGGRLVVVTDTGKSQEVIRGEKVEICIDPNKRNHGEAHYSRNDTEERTTSKGSKPNDPMEEKSYGEETKEATCITVLMPCDPNRANLKEGGVLKQIEEDCALMIFDAERLLQTY